MTMQKQKKHVYTCPNVPNRTRLASIFDIIRDKLTRSNPLDISFLFRCRFPAEIPVLR